MLEYLDLKKGAGGVFLYQKLKGVVSLLVLESVFEGKGPKKCVMPVQTGPFLMEKGFG